jgi:hypothetical protein
MLYPLTRFYLKGFQIKKILFGLRLDAVHKNDECNCVKYEVYFFFFNPITFGIFLK